MMKITKYILILFLICTSFIISQTKQGGVCFRVDDDGDASRITDYVNIFQSKGLVPCLAINFEDFPDPSYASTLISVQNKVEIMDHTPSHTTSYFLTIFTPSNYIGLSGVDHISSLISNKICLQYVTPPAATPKGSGTVNTSGHTLTYVSGSTFNSLNFANSENFFIYLPSLSKLVIVTSNTSTTATVTDAWGDDINLGTNSGIAFECYHDWDIQMTQAALQRLAAESQLARAYYGLASNPTTWIQPGGYHPMITRADAKSAFSSMGYSTAATYPDESYKVFNEYDPSSDKRWGLQWGDFDQKTNVNTLKTTIADGIAIHKVLIGSLHFFEVSNWTSFFSNLTSLLDWLNSKSIPVNTYSGWANTLYNTTPDANENIFPPLNVDLDENSSPDGYSVGSATYNTGDGVSASGNCSFSTTSGSGSNICGIYGLGGVEKGNNDFVIWTKNTGTSSTANSILVTFEAGDNEAPSIYTLWYQYEFPCTSSAWQRYTLADDISGNGNPTSLTIPNALSLLNIYISVNTHTAGSTINISGMALAPTGSPALPVELTSFTALTKNDGFELTWRTETEVDNYGFDVERKINDAWQKIGFVKGSGNSNSPKMYSFNDNLVAPDNTIQYRLKQIDTDGKYKYSNIVEVSAVPTKFVLYQNYPNPFNPSTSIKYSLAADSKVKLEVFNIIGEKVAELINEFQPSGNYTIEFNGSKLASGTYIYKLQAGDFIQVKKLVLIK